MDGGGGSNSSIGIAAGLGAAGGSGFFLSYLLVALLFALPCSVPCLNATMACVACEACPDDCCMGVHDEEKGHPSEGEDSELIHAQRKKQKKKKKRRGRGGNKGAAYQRLQGQGQPRADSEEEVTFDRVRYVSGASNYRLHEKLLDQSQPVVQPTEGAAPTSASTDDATLGPPLPSKGPPPGPPPLLSSAADDDDDGGDDYGSDGEDEGDYDDLEMGVHAGDHASEGSGGGHFGTFLILVELLASIPESLLLAAGLAEGKTPTAILASVIILNFAAGFAMFVDLIRPAATGNRAYGQRGHTEARIHQLMFLATSAAAGMLIFSIAAEVYVEFEEKDPECSVVNSYNPLLELFGGTIFGGFLVILLVWLSGSRYAHRYKDKLMRKLTCFRRRASRSSSSSSSSSSTCSLGNAYLKAFVLVLFLSLWLFLLTIFGYLIFTGASGSNNFIEGISGGAFIITIGGTLIPEAQKSAQLSGWSSLRKEIISAVTFLLGFLAAVVVVVFAEEEHVCIPKSSLNATTTP